jgi:methionyl-tRNA formyltransferase
VAITDLDTTESLTPKLAAAAGELLNRQLAALLKGSLNAEPQEEGATLTRMMTKADGWLDFSRPAVQLEKHVRAMWPWPRAWTTDPTQNRIQIHAADVNIESVGQPGEVVHRGQDVLVGTAEGSLTLRRVQLPGAKPSEGSAIVRLQAFAEGVVLGTTELPEPLPPLVRPVEG